MPPQDQRSIEAEDLYRLQLIGDPHLSPDGHYVVYSLQRVDRVEGEEVQQPLDRTHAGR